MLPVLKPNDHVIISSLPFYFSSPKTGDIVLFEHNKKTLVKKISKISGNTARVVGENKSDSLKIKAIRKDQILGKVIYIIKQ
jgi:phage repressor protein C with HTH and peptisase S24 domain